MNGKMSEQEINLLTNNTSNNENIYADSESIFKNLFSFTKVENGLYKSIDFRRPNKLQYDNLGALKQIHEQFSKSLNNHLTLALRCSVQADVDFEKIEQLTYQQYTTMSNKNYLWSIFTTSDKKDASRCFVQFDSDFCDFFIDRSFGGSAIFKHSDESYDYSMSDINKEISKKLFINILDIYEHAWNSSNIVQFKLNLASIEDNVQNIGLGIMSSEMMLIIPIAIRIYQKAEDGLEDIINTSWFNIGIPYPVIEPVLDKLNISNILSSSKSSTINEDVKNVIQKMNNNIDVYIGETNILFKELLELSKGDIVSLDKGKNEPYNVYVAGIEKYLAKPYVLDNKFCLKILKEI